MSNTNNKNQCSGLGGCPDANTNYQALILKKDLNVFTKVMDSIINSANLVNDISSIIQNEINQALNDYINKPLDAVIAINRVLKIPAQLSLNIANKVNGYAVLIDTIIQNNAYNYSQKAIKEAFLIMSGASMTLSIAYGDLEDKNQSLYVENKLLEYENKILMSLETIEGIIGADPVENYKAGEEYVINTDAKNELIKSFDLSRKYLIQNISELPIKMEYTLNRNRNMIDLIAELYNTADDEFINKFISDNNIVGNELLMMNKGRKVYYFI